MNHRSRLVLLSLGTVFLANAVASSLVQSIHSNSNQLLQNILTPQVVAAERTLDASSLVEMIMFGLAGIPVYKAVGFLLPFLKTKKNQAKQKDMGRVLQRGRSKRDLPYAQQLLDLLISVETALEKYGVTEPQCQLRATCQIYKRSAGNKSRKSDKNFIKLVNEMRREIQNPKVVPLAKYVFEYYEEAAIRGEQQCDCQEKYPKCVASFQTFLKKPKGRRPQNQVRNHQ
ncbi:uncharacterized protein [Parasteatoda tepidariorum]|uniref:uncharacterized protein n=1 Tax=Parasteatoda tepidariorum TaxID=114398 RepID=UPI00077FAC25|nr:uncharacterized protein LOC107456955 [Parasteatoda tepidariorum]